MRLRRGDSPLARHLAVAVAVLLPLGLWWLRRFPTAPGEIFDPCLLRTATGVPCPTCGGTRAVMALADGQPATAIAANPLVTVAVLALGVWAVGGLAATFIAPWRRRIEASPGDGRRLAIGALVLLVVNWAWLLIRGQVNWPPS